MSSILNGEKQIRAIHLEGYGQKLISTYQSLRSLIELGNNHPNKLDFPLILGRDFCGEVVRKGPSVTKFNVGDKVERQNYFEDDCILLYLSRYLAH